MGWGNLFCFFKEQNKISLIHPFCSIILPGYSRVVGVLTIAVNLSLMDFYIRGLRKSKDQLLQEFFG